MTRLRSYLVLCKAPLSLFAACSAVTGFLLAPDLDPVRLGLLASGTLLLAAGASALNQYQDRDIDALMERTRQRPLPAGTLAGGHALALSIILIAAGLAALGIIGAGTAALGALTVLWYNGVYTPLKRRTAFAAIPGAVVGALPPVIGWAAGGGTMADPKVLALAVFFFLWQVPHFWLYVIAHQNDYEQADLPHIVRALPGGRHMRLVLLWTASASAACFGFPLFGLAARPGIAYLVALYACWITAQGVRFYRKNASPAAALALFRSSTVFLALIMFLVSLDALLRRS